jgi:hypothetical protein
MGFWKYNIFKSEPKDLKTLRLHMDSKAAEYYKNGQFWFTTASKDDQPTLCISSGSDQGNKDTYLKIAEAKVKDYFITGTYESKKSSKDGFYDLTVDSTKATVFDKMVKEKNFDILIRACFAQADPKAIKIASGSAMRAVGEIKANTVKWTVCVWDLTRVMTLPKGQGVLDSEPYPGEWRFKDEQKKLRDCYISKGGLKLPATLPVAVDIEGAVVEKAIEGELLQWFRDPVTGVMKEHAERLKQKLLQLDKEAEKEASDKSGGKPKAAKAATDALATFQTDFQKAAIEGVEKRWFEYVQDHVELKIYEWDVKVSMVKQSLAFGISVATAAAGGISGVGAVLGLIGTIQTGLTLVRDVYSYFRDIEGLEKELGRDLARTLARYALDPATGKPTKTAGFEELGKALLDKLPGVGIVVTDIIKVDGTKTTESLEKNWTNYKGKVTKSFVAIEAAQKKLRPLMDEAKEAADTLKEPRFQVYRESGDAEMKRILKMCEDARDKAEQALDTLLVEIAGDKDTPGKFKQFADRKEAAEKFKAQLDDIKKGVPTPAQKFKQVAMPLLDLVWSGMDFNADKVGAIMTLASASADLAVNAADALAEKYQTQKETVQLAKTAHDQASSIRSLVEAVKSLRK